MSHFNSFRFATIQEYFRAQEQEAESENTVNRESVPVSQFW